MMPSRVLITGSDPEMTDESAIPAHIRGFLMFSWDAPHACGITDHRQHAINEAQNALDLAAIGTVAVVKAGPLSGELPDRVIGYAERRESGVWWIPGSRQNGLCTRRPHS
jgi:hypothetical protein